MDHHTQTRYLILATSVFIIILGLDIIYYIHIGMRWEVEEVLHTVLYIV